jgi:hypothetical protein
MSQEDGFKEVGPGEIGRVEVDPAEIRIAEVRLNIFLLAPPCIPHPNALSKDLAMLRVRHHVFLALLASQDLITALMLTKWGRMRFAPSGAWQK